MDTEVKEITINGVEYVKKGLQSEPAEKLDGMRYVIIRAKDAGVFAGYLESKEDQEVVLRNARRLWYWSGAASLSQLAMEGTKKPGECKFPCEVDRIEINQVIEVIDTTRQAQNSIKGVAIWEQK
jgi:hypothetical protein